MATVSKRIYVGGLYPGISETELTERFSKYGTIEKVDIKHKQQLNGLPEKTFAYLNFSSTDDQLQKCFSLFNKTKWKGHELKLQVAKENFLERLKEERQNNFEIPDKKVTKKNAVNKPLEGIAGVKDFIMSGAVPGTPVTEEKTWIVGKYGRVLPVVHIRSRDKRKMIKVDPSKFCHFVKKMKDSQATEHSDENMETLTWNIEENVSEMVKKRKGEFPEWQTQKRNKRSVDQTLLQQNVSKTSSTPKHSEDSDFEVVSSHLDLSCQARVYFSEESDEDTDYEAMFKQKQLSVPSSDVITRTAESVVGSSEFDGTVGNQHTANQAKTTESRPQSKHLHASGQNIVCSQNTKETKKSFELPEYNKNDIIIDSDVSSDMTPSPSVKTLELSPNTELKHTKQKLQPFRGIQQLYDSINTVICHQSTKVPTKQNNNDSGNRIQMFTQQHHLNESLSPHIPSISDSDSESVSSADTDVVIASAKKSKMNNSPGVVMDTLHNTSIHDEYSNGLYEERTGFCSQDLQEDSDIEDDFEKLVKGALQKQVSAKNPAKPFAEQNEINLERGSLNSYKEKSFSLAPDKSIIIPSVIKESQKKYLNQLSESDSGNHSSNTDKMKKNEKAKDKQNLSMQTEKGKVYTDKTKPAKITKQGESQDKCLSSELKAQAVQKSGKIPASSSAKKMEKKIETNEKRLKSLEERKQENCVQKSLIKQALSSIDKCALPNKKIIFDSDDEDFQSQNIDEKIDDHENDESDDDKEIEDSLSSDSDTSSTDNSDTETNLETKKKKTGNMEKKMLFDSSSEDGSSGSLADDEDDDEETFRLRPQFEGDKGQKLMELQMRFGNDERFKLDERFNDKQEDSADDRLEENDAEEVDEKTRSLRVLQEVVGTAMKMPVNNKEKSKRLFRDMSSLQYDPDTDHHRDLELDGSSQQQQKKKKSKTKKGNLEENETEKGEVEMPQVSKDRFYEVSETLTQVFRNKSVESQETSFSLLSAFGSQDRGDNPQETEEKADDLTTSNPQDGKLSWQRVGVLDSSEESDIEEDPSLPVQDRSSSHAMVFSSKIKTFFFTEGDGRIAEGIANFCRHGDLEEIREKWLEKRPDLVESYRTKHKRLVRKARLMDRKRIQNKKIQQRKEILKS